MKRRIQIRAAALFLLGCAGVGHAQDPQPFPQGQILLTPGSNVGQGTWKIEPYVANKEILLPNLKNFDDPRIELTTPDTTNQYGQNLFLNNAEMTTDYIKSMTKNVIENRPNPADSTIILSDHKFEPITADNKATIIKPDALMGAFDTLPSLTSGQVSIDLESLGIKSNSAAIKTYVGYGKDGSPLEMYTIPFGKDLTDQQVNSAKLTGVEYLKEADGFFGSRVRDAFTKSYEEYLDTVVSTICSSRFKPTKIVVELEASGGVIVAGVKANGTMEFETAAMCTVHAELMKEKDAAAVNPN